ncbi:circadian clock-controlled protein daywake-like [Cydia splendana]|uniref:circadian clock-controlled protein daywake-like n=1 Tax=Cydia splendana TaxID=1100963 RepID=UPI002128734E
MKLELIFCAICVIGSRAANLPSYITPCSRNLPIDKLTECVTTEARRIQPEFAKGIPEFGLEPIDPLPLDDIVANAGTFIITSKNLLLKGLKKMEIREVKFNFDKNTGSMKLFGNMTFVGDYETDGAIVLIPIKGNGKITVKCLDTNILIKYKLRKIKDGNGVEHLETYDLKQSEQYGRVVFHLTNLPGGETIGNTINQVMNDNWKDLIKQLGPPYTKAVATKVHEVINKLYSNVPFDQLFAL